MIKRYAETARERFLSEEELQRLGTTLAKAEAEGSERANVINAIRLLALTGCRLGEILNLYWEDVNLDAGLLILPDTKTGKHSHVLAGPAIALLKQLPRIDGSKALPDYTMQKAWQRLRKAANLDNVRLHDLRHTVGTYAGQSGANAFLIRDLLRHKSLQMTGQYVSRNIDPLRSLSEDVQGRIATVARPSS